MLINKNPRGYFNPGGKTGIGTQTLILMMRNSKDLTMMMLKNAGQYLKGAFRSDA